MGPHRTQQGTAHREAGVTKHRRPPPLTPNKTRQAMEQLQALYGGKALPKEPTPVEPEPPKSRGNG